MAMTEAGPQILFVCLIVWLSFMNIAYLILFLIRNISVVVVEVPGRDEGHDGGGPANLICLFYFLAFIHEYCIFNIMSY